MELYTDKYTCEQSEALDTLKKYGVAIVPSVLSQEECEKGVADMWDWLGHISQTWEKPIEKENKESWRGFKQLYSKHSMLLQQWGIGHAQFVWDVRQNPKVVSVFADIWKTEKLLTSFDGASIHLPPEITNLGWYRRTWLHSDQSFLRNGFECVQGQVNLMDTNVGDATLCVLEGSHALHKTFAETFAIKEKGDWFKLEEAHVDWFLAQGCKEARIKSPKGSVVLWDSRTIHCGVEPLKGRKEPNLRCCVYTCYQPRVLCSKRDLDKRVKALDELRTTSHWAARPKLFPKTPRTYGAELPDLTPTLPPTLTDVGRSLV